jgi:hypothetical protein
MDRREILQFFTFWPSKEPKERCKRLPCAPKGVWTKGAKLSGKEEEWIK